MYYSSKMSTPEGMADLSPTSHKMVLQVGARIRCTIPADRRFGRAGRIAQVIDAHSVLVRWEDAEGSSLSRIAADWVETVETVEAVEV